MKRKIPFNIIILMVVSILNLVACSKKDYVDRNVQLKTTVNESATEEKTTEETKTEEISSEELTTEEKTTEELTTEELTMEEKTSEEKTTEEKTTEESTTEETTTDEPATEESTTEESTTEKSTISPTEPPTVEKDTEKTDNVEVAMKKLDVTWNQGYIDKSGNFVKENTDYVYSDFIKLTESDVLKYRATGSTSVSLLVLYDTDGRYEAVIEKGGKWHAIDRYYHAEKPCYVRICKRLTDNTKPNCYEVGDAPTYILEKNPLKTNLLYGKSMLVIGDSLIYGNKIGNDAVWVNQLGMKYGMDTFNYGINGNTVSNVNRNFGIPMSERYVEISEKVQNPDIIIVEGGANDKNNNCIIGENSDTTNETFKGALNVLIDGLREKYPDKVILFMTCFERYGTKNELGLKETDYAIAMMEICEIKGIPCFNNVENSGISLLDDKVSEWADEGVYLENTDRKNKHFSPRAYAYLSEKYEEWIVQYLE